jgi:PKD repeat protein
VNRSTVGVGEAVKFNGTQSSGRQLSATWDGPGISSSNATVTHRFSEPGTYQVNLTVSDVYGRTSTDTVTVTVENESSASVAASEREPVAAAVEPDATPSWSLGAVSVRN